MNLFDFEYPESELSKRVAISVVDLRAEIVGFRIVWNLRKGTLSMAIERKRFLRNRLEHFKQIKRKYPYEYQVAHEMAREEIK